jgi:RecA-family ATPase
MNKDPISFNELLNTQYGEHKWLVENLIPDNGITMISGEPRSYKTWILLHIAMAVATGGLVFGKFQAQPGRVLMIDEENRKSLLKSRFEILGAKSDSNLQIDLMVKTGFALDRSKDFDYLYELVEKNKYKLVTLDSFVRIHSKDENMAREVSEIFKLLGRIQQLGTSIVITHHHRKEQAGKTMRKSQSLRGSSDILAALDSHLSVDRNKDQIEITQTKLRDAEELETFTVPIEKTENSLRFGFKAETTPTTKPALAKIEILKLFIGETKEFGSATIFGALLVQGIGRDSIRNALEELIAESKLVVRKGPNNANFYSINKQS